MAPEVEHDAVFDELVRCPRCGSLNDPSAAWCGQCLAEFEPEPEVPSGPHLNAMGQPLVDPEPMLTPDVGNGLFGMERGKAVWRCSRCFARNPMESDVCSDCDLAFIESARREAGAFTDQLSEDSARTTMGIMTWGARFMLVIGGLVAPIVLLWTAVAGGVAYLVRKMFGRGR
jgi:ribosomal protein L40E